MKTVYGRLTTLLFLVIAALLLFLPMRSGLEDHLYAYPRNLRMNKDDSYDIVYELDADHAQAINYVSVDPSIADVDINGRVTAKHPGATDIQLTAEGGARTTVHVEVAGVPTTTLVLNTDYVSMEKGQVTGLTASFNDEASDTRLEWRSMDPAIAEVSNVGRVTAKRGGRTQVYAIAPSGLKASAAIFVHVAGDVVRIAPEELTVGTGATLQMDTYYFPDDATDEVIGWSSNDTHILSVDDDGVIHALSVGQAILSVFTNEGLSGSAVINVEPSSEQFDLNPSAVTIERGDSIDLEPRFFTAEGEPDETSRNHYIEWISSEPEIASVENGRVVGHKSGRTRITATVDGMTASCDLRVQVLVHEILLDQEQVFLLRPQTVEPIQLGVTISPADPDDPTLTFTTSNDLVANVSPDGLVTMTGGYGTAIITVQAASGAVAHFVVNVVTELPDPDATPTPMPPSGSASTQTNTDSQTEVPVSGGFSFDDIGNSVTPQPHSGSEGTPASGGFSFDDIGNSVTPQPHSGGAESPASGGFSFDDIGNGVDGRMSLDEAGIAPTNTPRTNMSQEAEAGGLFEY